MIYLIYLIYGSATIIGALYAMHAHQHHLRLLSGEMSAARIWYYGVFMMITRFFTLLGIGWLAVTYGQAQPVPLAISFVIGYTGMMVRYVRG